MLQLVNLFLSNFLKVESPEPVVSKLTRYISIVASDSENEPQPSVTREKRKRGEILETTIATASAKGLDPLPVDILKILNSNIATEGFNVKLQSKDYDTIRGNEWINDEIINFYGKLLEFRANGLNDSDWKAQSFIENLRVWVLSTFHLTAYKTRLGRFNELVWKSKENLS